MQSSGKPCQLMVLGVLVALFACGDATGPDDPMAACSVTPIDSGFGAPGPYDVEVVGFSNPDHPALWVTLHVPVGRAPAPLVVFAHGNGMPDPRVYSYLIRHIVSRGYAVVHSPYANSAVHADRYAALWSGVTAAVSQHGARIDRSRVGFVGHSYGAGALPSLAHKALVEHGWGERGTFLFAMAPWYALEISEAAWRELPSNLHALILTFGADETNDHRIAIDQFRALSLAEDQKSYLMVRSDAYAGCKFTADHAIPQTSGHHGRHDPFDVHAVARLFDALAAAAFDGDTAARGVAFGAGSAEQIDMGRRPDGSAFAPLSYSDDPEPARPESYYMFRQSDRDAWVP